MTSPKVKHFAAITDPTEFGALLRAIGDYQGDPSVIYALKLAPHVFQRPGELRQMEWAEVDFDKAVWTIPIAKMKMRQPHSVPLSRQALAILKDMRSLSGSGRYVFPSIRTRARPIDEQTRTATIQTAPGKTETLNLDAARDRHMAHAYAETAFAAQGRTADHVIIHVDSRATNLIDQKSFYVGISRAKESATVFTNDRAKLVSAIDERAGQVQTAIAQATMPAPAASKAIGVGLG